jgi:hypothetical protein
VGRVWTSRPVSVKRDREAPAIEPQSPRSTAILRRPTRAQTRPDADRRRRQTRTRDGRRGPASRHGSSASSSAWTRRS